MDCNAYMQLISGHIDGVNTEKEERLLQEHLKICPDCRALLDAYRSMDEELKQVEEIEPPADLTQRIMKGVAHTPQKKKSRKGLFWGIGSGIAAAACFALVFFAAPHFLSPANEAIPQDRDAVFAMEDQMLPEQEAREIAPDFGFDGPGTDSLQIEAGIPQSLLREEPRPVLVLWDTDPYSLSGDLDFSPASRPAPAVDPAHSPLLFPRFMNLIPSAAVSQYETSALARRLSVYEAQASGTAARKLLTDSMGTCELAVYYPKEADSDALWQIYVFHFHDRTENVTE